MGGLVDRETVTLFDPIEPAAPVVHDDVAAARARMDRAREAQRVAEAERDAALVQVEVHADPAWAQLAYDFLLEYLVDNRFMFVDDLWDAGLPSTREDRALGAVFQRAARAGFMRKEPGQYRKSVRSHMTEKPVWRSLIYKPAT